MKNREQSGAEVGKAPTRDPMARRRRWLLLAAVGLAWAGCIAGVSAPHRLAKVGQVDVAGLPKDVASTWTISQLSKGAPSGAVTLADVPVTSGNVQPVAA